MRTGNSPVNRFTHITTNREFRVSHIFFTGEPDEIRATRGTKKAPIPAV
ncbi:MAG: hypothetical protein ACRES7_08125 [Gammaproteobacteria bacterium]